MEDLNLRQDFTKQILSEITNHRHDFKSSGNYLECSCGKKILAFQDLNGVRTGIRANGRSFSKKADQSRFFRYEELERFENALKPAMKHTIKMLFNTGARIMEIRNAKIQDFIYAPSGRSTIILRRTKTKASKGEYFEGKPRTIPLSKQFAKYLADWIKENDKKPEQTFKIHSTSAVKIACKKAAEKIGLSHPEDISAHTFRKTFETWLMALRVDSVALCAHLGHNVNTAAKYYISPDIFSFEEKNQMRKKLGDIYL